MAFSHVRKAFRPIRRDFSKHTTDFIQQPQVPCMQTSIARKRSYQKYKDTCTLNNDLGSTRFEHLQSQLTTTLSCNETKEVPFYLVYS